MFSNLKNLELFLRNQDLDLTVAKAQARLNLENLPNTYDHDSIQFPVFPSLYGKDPIIRAQKWLYSGFVIVIGNAQILVDPGIEILSRLRLAGINPVNFTHIVITHDHIDHCNDYLVAAEAMSYKSRPLKGTLIAPQKIISQFNNSDFRGKRDKGNVFNLVPIESINKNTLLEDCQLEVRPMRHHGAYGFKLSSSKGVIGYTSDTGYSKSFRTPGGIVETGSKYLGEVNGVEDWHEDITKFFENTNTLVANHNDHNYTRHSKTHLTTFDIIHLALKINPQKIVITHQNPFPALKNYQPRKIAEFIQKSTRVATCYAGENGLTIKL